MKRLLDVILTISLIFTGTIPAHAESTFPQSTSSTQEAKDEYIIRYKDLKKGATSLRQSLMSIQNGEGASSDLSFVTAELSDVQAAALAKDNNVALIEKNHSVFISSDSLSYNLANLHVREAQQTGSKGSGVKIAILDTGISPVTDLHLAGGASFVAEEPDTLDYNGHGTAVASILGALDNDEGLVGVAPNVEIFPLKVLDKEGRGSYSHVLSAINWAIENDMDVISMSFTGFEDSFFLKEAVDTAAAAGILVIAAAGNGGTATAYPAKYESVLSVGAVDEQSQLAAFSNRGKIDVVAPGVNIPVYSIDGSKVSMSGTSMAVPHVAGIVALLKERSPELSGEQLKTWVKDTAVRLGRIDQFGYGLVDAIRALNHEIDPNIPQQAPVTQNQLDSAYFAVPDAVYTTVYESVYEPIGSNPELDPLIFLANQSPDIQQLNAIKNNNLKADSAPFTITDNQENVSTLSGGISIQENDLFLPGRNGLSFTLGRTYSSDSSQLYESDVEPLFFCIAKIDFTATMYEERSQDKVAIYQNPNSFYTGTLQYNTGNLNTGVLNNLVDATLYANYLNGQAGKTWYLNWEGPDAYGFYTRKVIQFPQNMNAFPTFESIPGPPIVFWRTKAIDKTDEEKRFPIGKGWSWNIPYVKTQRDKSYLSMPGKGTYEIRGTSLVGYPWKDLSLRYDSSVSVEGRQSSIALATLNGVTYYFHRVTLFEL